MRLSHAWLLAFAATSLGSGAITAEQPNNILGIQAGQTAASVEARLGAPLRCAPGAVVDRWCAWENDWGAFLTVSYVDEQVTYVYVSHEYSGDTDLALDSADDMRSAWGREDIRAVSAGGSRIRYTYLHSGLTVNFDDDELAGYAIGPVTWRASATLSEYHLGGVQLCPSAHCPFQMPSRKLRPEFASRSAADLLADIKNGALGPVLQHTPEP
ncbi:hypothetical protein GH975_11855 [Litorivicinus lipolyticus]|uniref:Uncharacterized protein n=1 Tax=Litorivicinus lipolyticus TaxID=418701 RepID=A0A5Q2QFS1_9GAMM|nr:hypothetical protein [Litorivicinus lipolyticus]QGG81221.1 hypothetical protein GH975_11855 [Litorivicinus lipolyticus]